MKTLACLRRLAAASRVAVPVFKDSAQVESNHQYMVTTLKKMIALATIKREFTKPGTKVPIRDYCRSGPASCRCDVVKTFLQSKRKTATPVI